MAENKNNFDATVASLFKGMDSFVSAKTVVGDAVTVNDTIILPLVDVSFGVGAGAFAGEKKNNAGGAMTGKMSPSAVLVIQNGATKLVNIKNQDTVTKFLIWFLILLINSQVNQAMSQLMMTLMMLLTELQRNLNNRF